MNSPKRRFVTRTTATDLNDGRILDVDLIRSVVGAPFGVDIDVAAVTIPKKNTDACERVESKDRGESGCSYLACRTNFMATWL